MILLIKDDGCAGPLERLPGLWRWFHDIDFSHPPLEPAVRSVQRCTSSMHRGVCGLLKLLLTGFLFIPSITLIITGFLLSTSGGLSMVPKGLAGAVCFTTSALTASNILTFFLVMLLILCFLLLDKLLNLITLLKVVALGPMNLAIRPITFPSFLGSSGFPAVSAHGNFLVGDICFGLLAGTRHARTFHTHHCLISWLLAALLALSLTG